MRSFIVLFMVVSCLPALAEDSKVPPGGFPPSHDTLRGVVPSHEPLLEAPASATRPTGVTRPDNVQTLGGSNVAIPFPARPALTSQVEVVTSEFDALLAGDRNRRTGAYVNGLFANPQPPAIPRSEPAPVDPIVGATLRVFGFNGGAFTSVQNKSGCQAITCTKREIPDNKLFVLSGQTVLQNILHFSVPRAGQVTAIANEGINRFIVGSLAMKAKPMDIWHALGATGALSDWMTRMGITDTTLRAEIAAEVISQVNYENLLPRISLIQSMITPPVTAQR